MDIQFQSTPPLWEATTLVIAGLGADVDFNPRLHYGRRLSLKKYQFSPHWFQSTPPLWEATYSWQYKFINRLDFNPRLHYGRRLSMYILLHIFNIDFNPRLHYGRRRFILKYFNYVINFNPRLHYGRRPTTKSAIYVIDLFQSTPPLWEATGIRLGELSALQWFQSTPPLWEATMR